jgi:nucleotide-binding universal stress UspA family protein
MVSRIVVGVDGSEGSRLAAEWAADEAERWNARVVVVQAWEFTPLVVATDAPIDLVELRTQADETLAELVREIFQDRVADVQARVVEELPATAVLDACAEIDADLVVVGSHGKGGLKGMLLGSVSQKVVHHAPCPVVVVPISNRG